VGPIRVGDEMPDPPEEVRSRQELGGERREGGIVGRDRKEVLAGLLRDDAGQEL
jgi:hypothetical protein